MPRGQTPVHFLAICLTGHLVVISQSPILRDLQCKTCGASVSRDCDFCSAYITQDEDVGKGRNPDICFHCGSLFPWASGESVLLWCRSVYNDQAIPEETRDEVLEIIASLMAPEKPLSEADISARSSRLRRIGPRAIRKAEPIAIRIGEAYIKKRLGIDPG